MVWYSHLLKNFPQFIVIHTVKGFGIVDKAQIDVFLELSCFFDDPAHVGNLISGSSAFSETSLNIWKFTFHVLLKPGLENFKHHFQFSSVAQSCPTLCDPMNCSIPGLPVHHQPWSSLKLKSIESVVPSSHLILCHPLFLLPPIPPSIRVFSNESTLCMRWPKYWSFSFCIIPSKEHPGLMSFRMHWLDLLAVQGSLKSLLQYHSSKVSILWHSAFFTVQLSHPYTTTGKTIALTRRAFVGKVMSLLLNMLSRLVITFLPRSKHLY